MSQEKIIVEVRLKDEITVIKGNTGGVHFSMARFIDAITEGKPLSIYTDETNCNINVIQDWSKVHKVELRWADIPTKVIYSINIV